MGAKAIYGVDINRLYVDTLRSKAGGEKENFLLLDVSKNDIPFPDDFFDLVVCVDLIYYLTSLLSGYKLNNINWLEFSVF